MKTVLFTFVLSLTLYAQTERIIEVIDANLFKLQGGRLVKLAGVDCPQLSHPSNYFQSMAKKAVDYSKTELLDRMVVVESVSKSIGKDYEFVIMYKKYLLSQSNINSKFLINGFGKFYDNVNLPIKHELLDSESEAIKNKRGIWFYGNNLTNYDTLDTDFIQNPSSRYISSYDFFMNKTSPQRSLFFQIPIEILAGFGVSFVTSVASGLIIYSFESKHERLSGLKSAIGGTIVGYILGFPTGVYLVAKSRNEKLSLPLTILSSVGSSITFFALHSVVNKGNKSNWFTVVTSLSPIIGSLLYTHVIESSPTGNYNNQVGFTHNDYYKSTQIFNINLLRINF